MQGYNLLTANFSNNERTIVEVYWCNDKGEDIQVEYIEAKEGDAAWENLLNHVTVDQLHENTHNHIRKEHEMFENTVVEIAKKGGLLYDLNTNKTATFKVVSESLFAQYTEEELKEYLFVYKLNLFENEIIKKSKDRTGKAAIRKATNIVEATLAACQLYQKELDK